MQLARLNHWKIIVLLFRQQPEKYGVENVKRTWETLADNKYFVEKDNDKKIIKFLLKFFLKRSG